MKKVISVSNYGQNITLKYEDDKKEYIKSRSKDDDDIIAIAMEYLKGKL